MVGERPTTQRIVTGYISGWRLWLSIIAVALSLTLLSQAHRISGLSLPPKATQAWTISAHGPLTPQQQREIERQLHKTIEQFPQSPELRYSLQPESCHNIDTSQESPAIKKPVLSQ